MGQIGSDSGSRRHEGRHCESQDVDGRSVAGGCAECGWDGWGDLGCGSDSVGHMAEVDARWAEGRETLKRFGRALRDQTAEEIEEAVAQAVSEVRD